MHSVPRRTPPEFAWLLPAGTLFLMGGILLGRHPEAWWIAALALACSLCAALLSRRWMRFAAAVLACASLGAISGWLCRHPALPQEGTYAVQAVVADEIEVTPDGHVQTLLTGVRLNGACAPDAYWTFYLDEGEALPGWLLPGTQVEVSARLYHPAGQTNPGGFDFREYLLQRGVKIGLYGAAGLQAGTGAFSLRGWTARLRHDLTLGLMNVMGPEAGAYAAAMLLGTKDFVPDDDKEAFRALGIAHILSVSGFHVAVLCGLMLVLLRPLPVGFRARTLLEAAVLAAYCLLTGGNAPVIRASALLLWRRYSRIRHKQVLPLHLLCVTAALQLLWNPSLLTGASFQLTYGAMLGLTLIYPWLRCRRTWRTHHGQRLWEAFCAAIAAQIGILAPQLYWFGELPLLSLLLNMLILPLASVLISLYWGTLLVLPIPLLREAMGFLSAVCTHLLVGAVRWMGSHAAMTLWTRRADIMTLAGCAVLVFGLSYLLPRQLRRCRPGVILLGALLVLALLIPLPEAITSYTQFDVGNADAAILQDKDMTIVIDTGDLDQTVAGYLHQRRQGIEALILTHLHIDHAGGLEAILNEGIPVEVCYLPTDAETPVIDAEAQVLLHRLAETGAELRYLHRGDVIELPSGRLTVLWPEYGRVSPAHDANDAGLVLQADIAGVTMLLMGDLPGKYEHYLSLPADILKASHHGSADATSPAFLAAVDPQLILLSNKEEEREARMAALAGDIPLYSTASSGAVTVQFLGDGQFTVETMK